MAAGGVEDGVGDGGCDADDDDLAEALDADAADHAADGLAVGRELVRVMLASAATSTSNGGTECNTTPAVLPR